MTIELRPYQQRMVGELYAAIRSGQRRLLWIALMGLGKTVLASWVMRDAVSKGKRCVFLVPLTVLIDQTIETLELLGVHCSALQGTRQCDLDAPVIVASMQTLTSRVGRGLTLDQILGHQDLILADEAHETAFHSQYEALEQWCLARGGLTIGMTATPWRLSKKQWLAQRFDTAIIGPQPPEAIKLGAVVPCRSFTLGNVFDLETLTLKSTGDYSEADMTTQATRPEALAHVVKEWQRLAGDRPTMMVGATIDQAIATQRAFNAAGIRTALIIGDTPLDERQRIFDEVKRGAIQVICSVGCLTAGFNLPAISCVLYIRATKSKSLFYQTAGRACRPAPGKTDFILLDFGGNVKRFGNPMSQQDYSIDEPKGEPIPPPLKSCPQCGAEVSNFAQICPECGYVFNDGEQLELADEAAVLATLTEYVDRPTREQIASLRRWRRAAWKTRTSPDQPASQFSLTYGSSPPAEWLRHACLGKRVSRKRKRAFIDWLKQHRNPQGKWAQGWLAHHLKLEFGPGDLETICDRQWGDVLGVHYSASWEQVKAAYQRRIQFETDPQTAIALNVALEDAIDETHPIQIRA